MRMIARAACDQLATEPGIVIHLEHVNASVRHLAGDGLLQGLFPTFRALMRQAGNQIDIDVRNPGRAQSCNVVQNGRPIVQPAYRSRLGVNEGLHAQADPVHPASEKDFQDLLTQSSGRTLDGDFGTGCY